MIDFGNFVCLEELRYIYIYMIIKILLYMIIKKILYMINELLTYLYQL